MTHGRNLARTIGLTLLMALAGGTLVAEAKVVANGYGYGGSNARSGGYGDDSSDGYGAYHGGRAAAKGRPVVKLGKTRIGRLAVAAKGLAVPVRCNRPCKVALTVTLKARHRTVVLGHAKGAATTSWTTVPVRLSARGRHAVKKARHAKLAVQATAVDTAGRHSAPAKRVLKLKG